MLDAQSVEQVDQVLGGEVAGRTRRIRAAAGAAGRRVEAGDAVFERRPRRWPAPCRACRGSGRRAVRAAGRLERSAAVSAWTWPGTPTPMVSPRQTSPRAHVGQAAGSTSTTRAIATAPVNGQPNAVDTYARVHQPSSPGALKHRPERGERCGDGHADVALRESVTGGGEDGQRLRAGRLGARHAAHVGDQHRITQPRRERLPADAAGARRRRPAAESRAAKRSW